ncbi:MAG: rhodanese-like domain-containing protein [Pseudomonadota bacterium]|nr:rhodanese-like domain-containing protein [Pseudomonadota bacterium]
MKTSKDYLSEANALVEKIDVSEGIEKHRNGTTLFIDVRDSTEITNTGTISNCLRIPRGMIEFVADASSPLYNDKLSKDKEIVLVCGAGGMAALTGRTLLEMGYKKIRNVGAIGDWIEAGGPIER